MISEQAAGHMTDMQREQFIRMWRISHTVAASFAILEHELHVLPGLVLHAIGRRELQRHDDHIVGDAFKFGHAYRDFFDRKITHAKHLAGFDGHIRLRYRAAEQRVSGGLFGA